MPRGRCRRGRGWWWWGARRTRIAAAAQRWEANAFAPIPGETDRIAGPKWTEAR